MDAYEHFGLEKPPFDPLPDAEFFYDAPAHAEALATLQYAVFARKGCVAVVGESGYGKTLLARITAASTDATTPILWLDARAQPDNATKVSVYPAGSFGQEGRGAAVVEATLSAETHAARSFSNPPVLVVDSADELPARGWRDVLAWTSNELRYSKPVSVLLFGSPRLLDMLAAPELARLQWRIFRVCRLEPLSPELTKEYVHARITAAGGDAARIFSDATIAEIGRLGQGNPARINQLCDNALLEAYGEDRDCVAPADVNSALHAVFGGYAPEHAVLPGPQHPNPLALGPPPLVETSLARPLPMPAQDLIDTWLDRLETRLSHALHMARQTLDGECFPGPDTPVVPGSPRAVTEQRRLLARPVAVEVESRTTSVADAQPTA